MNPFFHTDFSISDSLKTVRKSVLIYETIIVPEQTTNNNSDSDDDEEDSVNTTVSVIAAATSNLVADANSNMTQNVTEMPSFVQRTEVFRTNENTAAEDSDQDDNTEEAKAIVGLKDEDVALADEADKATEEIAEADEETNKSGLVYIILAMLAAILAAGGMLYQKKKKSDVK
ncbi:MAG: hypothetical protein PHP50_09265 [Lachnospiraceae bacterium]|nr:hypothetical protein [Lachnospiraceae bacterium]